MGKQWALAGSKGSRTVIAGPSRASAKPKLKPRQTVLAFIDPDDARAPAKGKGKTSSKPAYPVGKPKVKVKREEPSPPRAGPLKRRKEPEERHDVAPARRLRYELEGSTILPPISFSQDESSGAQRPRKKQRRDDSNEPPSTMFTQECSLVARTRRDRERMLEAMPEMQNAFEAGESYRELKREHSRIEEEEMKRRGHQERLADIKRRFGVDDVELDDELPTVPSLPTTPKVRSADDSAFVSDGLPDEPAESSQDRIDRLLRTAVPRSPVKLLPLPGNSPRDETQRVAMHAETQAETYTALRALFDDEAPPSRPAKRSSPARLPLESPPRSAPQPKASRIRPPRIILASETPPSAQRIATGSMQSPSGTTVFVTAPQGSPTKSPSARQAWRDTAQKSSPDTVHEPKSFHSMFPQDSFHTLISRGQESIMPPPTPVPASPSASQRPAASARQSPRSSSKQQVPSPLRQVQTVEATSPSPSRSRKQGHSAQGMHAESIAQPVAPVQTATAPSPVAGPSRPRADFSQRIAAAWSPAELESQRCESVEDSMPRQMLLGDFYESQLAPATRARQAAVTSALVESMESDRRRSRRVAQQLQRTDSVVDETQRTRRFPSLGSREDEEQFGPLNETNEVIEEAEDKEPSPFSSVEDTQVRERNPRIHILELSPIRPVVR